MDWRYKQAGAWEHMGQIVIICISCINGEGLLNPCELQTHDQSTKSIETPDSSYLTSWQRQGWAMPSAYWCGVMWLLITRHNMRLPCILVFFCCCCCYIFLCRSVNLMCQINFSVSLNEENMKIQNAQVPILFLSTAHICCRLGGWKRCTIAQERSLERILLVNLNKSLSWVMLTPYPISADL